MDSPPRRWDQRFSAAPSPLRALVSGELRSAGAARSVQFAYRAPMPEMDVVALQGLLTSVDAQYHVDAVTESGVILRLPASVAHIRPGGTISGPALMALADATAWCAVLAQIGPVVAAVSTSLHIDFLRRVPPVDVIGDGRVLKLGRSLAVIDVSIRPADEEALVAKAQVTYSIPPARPMKGG